MNTSDMIEVRFFIWDTGFYIEVVNFCDFETVRFVEGDQSAQPNIQDFSIEPRLLRLFNNADDVHFALVLLKTIFKGSQYYNKDLLLLISSCLLIRTFLLS